MTQLSLAKPLDEQLAKVEEIKLRKEKERLRKEEEDKAYEQKIKDFEANWKLGSTSVWLNEGKYYFSGDFYHIPKEHIFHNARKIRHEMFKRGMKYGHMNYNDAPTYDKTADVAQIEKERAEIYKEDLYCFKNEIELVYEIDRYVEYLNQMVMLKRQPIQSKEDFYAEWNKRFDNYGKEEAEELE